MRTVTSVTKMARQYLLHILEVQDLRLRPATPAAGRRLARQHGDGIAEGWIIVGGFRPAGVALQHQIILRIQFQSRRLRGGPAVRPGLVLGHLLDIWKRKARFRDLDP